MDLADDTGDRDGGTLRSRAYQLEMFRDSLQRNIIVAMDTGSGKTHIAVLRIQAEIERTSAEKLVWFLTTSKVLAEQQHEVISKALRPIQSKLLTGSDGVDRWSNVSFWDKILNGIRVIVSTHQVLLDALVHGFVGMKRLALLIFDEAHCATRDHPSNRIMRDFYHPSLIAKDTAIPNILGLTASPTQNSKIGALGVIEKNLNAVCRTPKLHREELLQYVHRPITKTILYPQNLDGTRSLALQSLSNFYANLDIERDPYVIRLRSSGHGSDSKKLKDALQRNKTYCQDQIKSMLTVAHSVHSELGSWATDYFISSCIRKFESQSYTGSDGFDNLEDTEKRYLRKAFAEVKCPPPVDSLTPGDDRIAPKVHLLIGALIEEMIEGFSGLIFVETRASVAILAHLLSLDTRTREIFKIGTFVGTSTFEQRNSKVSELVSTSDQTETLNDLRSGKKNLIIATSVLEEGIDVSACNVVICFQRPPNLKSFIQRRGRARQSKSTFVIMFEEGSGSGSSAVDAWQDLEEEMKRKYLDHMRHLEEIHAQEDIEEDCREFVVESTGAKLTLHDSVQHLYHFCATLPSVKHAELGPMFIYEGDPGAESGITGTVILPNSVDAAFRKFRSSRMWRTETNAKRDVAFEACVALHGAGLINDHLLPKFGLEEALAYADVEKRESLASCAEQLDPWPIVAKAWQLRSRLYRSTIQLKNDQGETVEMLLLSPCLLPQMSVVDLYWDTMEAYKASILDGEQENYDDAKVEALNQVTRLLFSSIYSGRMVNARHGFPLLFAPLESTRDYSTWQKQARGTNYRHLLMQNIPLQDAGLIRDMQQNGLRYIFQGSEDRIPDLSSTSLESAASQEKTLHLKLLKLQKRADFLHPVTNVDTRISTHQYVYLPAQTCEMDNLPFVYSQFVMFFPSITYRIGISIVTEHLCNSLLSAVQFGDTHLVTTAISASSAQNATNYQRLEFFGDSALKYLTAVTLMAQHLNWHEGYLSSKKDHIVSNARLAFVARQVGLDKYILTKGFTGYKWRPLYNEDLLQEQPIKTRELSTKVLADVVEALIGAAWLDGGPEKALICLSIFNPTINWLPLAHCQQILSDAITPIPLGIFPPHFSQLENLIAHAFSSKSILLEALTYPSHIDSFATPSYQRLEFLGDAVLDFIITTKVFHRVPDLPHHTMHLVRTALVNANFLGYHCMAHSIAPLVPCAQPVQDKTTGHFFIVVDESSSSSFDRKCIWHFMRHGCSPGVMRAQQECPARFDALRDDIATALREGNTYPWTLFARLDADKFFSDIIESLVGAIYIDTSGSMPACEAFLTTLGVLPYLDRVLAEDVHLLHPKEELGMVAVEKKLSYEKWFVEVEEEEKEEKGERGGKGGGGRRGRRWKEEEDRRRRLGVPGEDGGGGGLLCMGREESNGSGDEGRGGGGEDIENKKEGKWREGE